MNPNNILASLRPFVSVETKDEYSQSVVYAVHGFWSGDNVRISRRRMIPTGDWSDPEVNWSCGGRDMDKEPDGLVASECFAKAIAAAARVGKKWRKSKLK